MRVGAALVITLVAAAAVGAAPAAASPAPAGSSLRAHLDAVSCVSTTFCVGVGATIGADPQPYTGVIEMRDGNGWHRVPEPPDTSEYTRYTAVDCASVSFCMAVGWIRRTNPQASVNYAAARVWNGTAWSVVDPLGDSTELLAVSCTSSHQCEAGGLGYTTMTRSAIALGWNGSSWTQQAVPLGGSPETVFNGVSCADADHCTAVGHTSPQFYGPSTPLVETWSSSHWSIGPTPAAPDAPTSELTAVSCPAVSSCVAVGNADSSPFADHLTGTTWTSPPLPSSTQGTTWLGVSCLSAKWCASAGSVNGSAPVPATGSWVHGRWASTASDGRVTGPLSAASCVTRTFCIAVGWTHRSGKEVPLAERWNGTRWLADLT